MGDREQANAGIPATRGIRMTDRERLLWECRHHLDQRPIRRQESGPAAWLVITVGLALIGWVAYRLVDRWLCW